MVNSMVQVSSNVDNLDYWLNEMKDIKDMDNTDIVNMFSKLVRNLTVQENEQPMEQNKSEDTFLDNEKDHRHLPVFDPLLGEVFDICEEMDGVWAYTTDNVSNKMQVTLKQVPVFGLFIPSGYNRVVQRLPYNG